MGEVAVSDVAWASGLVSVCLMVLMSVSPLL
jgi:hypothetical protein